MPVTTQVDRELERIVSLIGLLIFPCCLSLSLPIFIYSLVLEKEKKLVETMKINGMKMYNYWLVNFIFDLLIYIATAGFYLLAGSKILGLSFFSNTDWQLLVIVCFGWGICQISMAFFFSVFINNTQTASIVGYSLSIWASTIACTLNVTVF